MLSGENSANDSGNEIVASCSNPTSGPDPKGRTWPRFLAVAIVVIMVASAFALISPGVTKTIIVPDEDDSAKSEVGGATRSIVYEVSRIGESYMKPTDYAEMGRHDHSVIGVNDWFVARAPIYNDTIVHKTYPCIVATIPYSDRLNKPANYDTASWTIHSYYQLKVDAENITELATGSNKDPWIIPIMGSVADYGGWVNMSMYITYLTPIEFDDVQAGRHYANTFYGVDAANVSSQFRGYGDDGYWVEIQGHFEFDRSACKKFLGLAGADLVAAFNAVGADNLSWKWGIEWINDGDAGRPLDIWAAYDYSLFSGNVRPYVHLKLDTANSNQDKISVWLWSQNWGGEVLYARYLDKLGINKNMKSWGEDWYLNGTFGPTNGDINERLTSAYHMTAWKDSDYFVTTWMLEPQHDDYTRDTLAHLAWKSYFDPYYWGYYGSGYNPTRMCWLPGQEFYGQRVHFWNTPMNWNLSADQKLVIRLPTDKPGGGIEPYWSNNYSLPNPAGKEMVSHLKWGEMVLGHGFPSKLYSPTYYNAATKTITIQGPDTFYPNRSQLPGGNPPYSWINETGSPLFMLDITPVSKYDLTIDQVGPYYAGVHYTLRVTPKNFSGVPVTNWNGTVKLTPSAGVTLGATSHTFTGAEPSWATTIVASSPGTASVNSVDDYFYLDVTDSFQFTFAGHYVPRGPIVINSNADFTAANGVTRGAGTPWDPYVIEGWQIADADVAITVSNTNAWFVIDDVHLHQGTGGVYFYTVDNAAVSNSVIEGFAHAGIAVWNSDNVVIDGSRFSDNGHEGIIFRDSVSLNISRNQVLGNAWQGIMLERCTRAWIQGNYLEGNVLADDTAGYPYQAGMVLFSCSGVCANHNTVIQEAVESGYDDAPLANVWDSGYPMGGNFWSAYSGADSLCGPLQDLDGSDQLGDAPYELPGGALDHFPVVLMLTENTAPVAHFSIGTWSQGGETLILVNAGLCRDNQDYPDALQVRWDWEDDGVWDTGWDYGKVATHKYDSTRSYTVRLQVSDSAGSTGEALQTTFYDAVAPVAIAGEDQITVVGTPVIFDGLLSHDDVGVTGYHWTIWDMQPVELEGPVVAFAFTTPGVYQVTLRVNDAFGNTASDSLNVTVWSQPISLIKLNGPARSSAIQITCQPAQYGEFYIRLDNYRLKSVIVDIYDITGGMFEQVAHENVRFSNYEASPYGMVTMNPQVMATGHTYLIELTPNGSTGSYALINTMFVGSGQS